MSCDPCALNYDNAVEICVIGMENTSIYFSVDFDGVLSLASGTIRFVLSKDERGRCPIMEYDEGAELSVADDEVFLNIPVDQNTLQVGTYYGQVRHDPDNATGSIIIKVTLEIRPTIARRA